MGVTGLWTVVAPTARPTQLATLNRKRLAVDASIWIYQFLKAVRDKEGNALRNSHVVGFFRRICKLLYFGVKPVFVFDGGAPVLKRETVRGRARRREGRREDAARTAGKLLAVQVARAAEDEDKRRRAERERTPVEEDLPPEQDLVYVDELGMTQKERQVGRGFKRKDQYHLPDLDVSIESLGAPNDPRIMSQAELEDYARHFHSGEDINLYDFSKIDFESPFFLSLPPGDRYNILNAARLRSRLRMGYSKDQLDGMFPDRMAFSKFQIERVKERNELTQRLMHVNGMAEDFLNQGGRIAGEKGKEYVLVKNDGVEGGWALGVVSNKQGTKREDAIDLDEDDQSEPEAAPSADEDDFEDVAIEGLNRIPKGWQKKRKEVDYDMSYEDAAAQIARKRKAVYEGRRAAAAQETEAETRVEPPNTIPAAEATDDLFVPQDGDSQEDDNDLFEDVEIGVDNEEEDEELQKAIAMSLQQQEEQPLSESGGFLQPNTIEAESNEADDGIDLQAALAESRRSKYQAKTAVREKTPPRAGSGAGGFSGPLPFESLNLGQSLLGKKKSKNVEEGLSGGFDRDLGSDAFRKERPAQPLPSWFDAAPSTNDMKSRNDNLDEDEYDDHVTYGREDVSRRETLRTQKTMEVIDLDAYEAEIGRENSPPTANDIASAGTEDADEIQVTSPGTEDQPEIVETIASDMAEANEDDQRRELEREERYRLAREIAAENEPEEATMGSLADRVQAEPPSPTAIPKSVPSPARVSPTIAEPVTSDGDIEWSESEAEREEAADSPKGTPADQMSTEPVGHEALQESAAMYMQNGDDEGEEFEDVDMQTPDAPADQEAIQFSDDEDALFVSNSGQADETPAGASEGRLIAVEEEYLSDSDEELMRQLAIEAEEHARFASSLSATKTPAEAARDYENELKQLRNQQKKDRRDADEVTQVMVQECQALLRLFGLPYITAPMEAEAQCAELVHLGLVDGIVTDDSDIFLFGGTRIYKNMFNAGKFVECYLASDLEKEYALDRKKLIRFAHLLGSDYTEGIPGIGPVSALEILTEFATLQEFKEWCSKVQLGRPQDLDEQLTTPFRRKFRNTVQKRLFLPPAFPDLRVDQAYLDPDVDSNPQEFQWGVPDLDKLRGFLMATIGWDQERTDEILVPVVRDMNRREVEGTQANITQFFGGGVGVGTAGKEGTAPRNRSGKESGRMAKAFGRLRGEAERIRRGDDQDGVADDAEGVDRPADAEESVVRQPVKKSKGKAKTNGKHGGKRKTKARARSPTEDGMDEEAEAEAEAEDEGSDFSHRGSKRRRKRRV